MKSLSEKIKRHLEKTREPISSLAIRSNVSVWTIIRIRDGGGTRLETAHRIEEAIRSFRVKTAPMIRRRTPREK